MYGITLTFYPFLDGPIRLQYFHIKKNPCNSCARSSNVEADVKKLFL